ncbi:MAG TPA: hypothetical protein VF912_06660 [Anaeromyxobacter sp.]
MWRHLLATVVLWLTPGLGAAAGRDAPADPCAAARARLDGRAASAVGEARAEIDAYRAAWRDACDPARGAADLAELLSDAEALVSDVRLARVAAALAHALEPDAPWPLPGVHRSGAGVDLDWSAFAAIVPRGKAEDARFFRGLSRALASSGEPVWLGAAPGEGAAPCLRLGETAWVEVARGIEEMDRADVHVYARHAADVRARLLQTLKALGRGGPVCGCVKGDPLPALAALAALAPGGRERSGTPERRALVAAGAAAAEAVRTGSARISWLRDAPDAPATGCGAGTR